MLSTDIISGIPRYDGTRLFGAVEVRSRATRTDATVTNLIGSQVSLVSDLMYLISIFHG